MALVVPAEGAHPVAVTDPQALQCLGQLLRPGRHLGEGGRAVAARLDRDHRAVAVHLLPVPEDVADQEGCVLHRALHGPSMSSARASCPATDRSPAMGASGRHLGFGAAALVFSAVLMAAATGVVSEALSGASGNAGAGGAGGTGGAGGEAIGASAA